MTGARVADADRLLHEVADAVRLQEGVPGVRSVLRAIRRLSPASTKEISRATSLPVPIVAAVGNELRRRGLLTEKRPSRLTPAGVSLVAGLGMDLSLDATCTECDGRELVIPPVLDEAVRRLSALMETGPGADMALDQSRCTPETKVRRVLALLRAGVLPGGSLLLVGDDDMISLALAVVGDVLGSPLVERLTVVDISPDILGHIAEVSSRMGFPVETVRHDLRNPLPEALHGRFDAAMTDPPYTPEGAQLFLSRAVEGLRPGPAHSIFFSFGAKSPNEMFEVQQEIVNLGLVVNGFIHNFNEYEGSGILGGSGFFQHLLTTNATQSSVGGSYQGPLYTRDKRSRQREYECVSCHARVPVGPGARWTSVGALRADGCPACGGGPFKPRQLVSLSEDLPQARQAVEAPRDGSPESTAGTAAPAGAAAPAPATAAAPEPAAPGPAARRDEAVIAWPPAGERPPYERQAAPFRVRPADERDIDAIADFEVDIARVSFGDAAVDDPARHRARLAKAMERSRKGMFVATHPDDDTAVGWLWMSDNQNTMTGDRYANFRSLAVAEVEQRSEIAELLIATGLDFAVEHGLVEVVGKVYSGNVPMRTMYRKFGFESTHMSMKLRLVPADRTGR
ncbi:GNAT family N-acetyltransferase [Streptomyces sp. NPDC018031]|uniref:GNAT family N-acetyltransferase n=1 Tax=Streptomyces sp. NPDC018031 TaxID=3365033 RepID=UPI0037970E8A